MGSGVFGRRVRLVLLAAFGLVLTGLALLNACSCGGQVTSSALHEGLAPDLVVIPGNTQNTLQWAPVSGAVAYDVYWRVENPSAAKGSLIAGGVARTNTKHSHRGSTFVHSGLRNGWRYGYWVVVSGADEPKGQPRVFGAPSDTLPCEQGASCMFQCPVFGMTSCDNVCTTLSSDPLNCGACGNRCYWGDKCSGATCIYVPMDPPAPATSPAPIAALAAME